MHGHMNVKFYERCIHIAGNTPYDIALYNKDTHVILRPFLSEGYQLNLRESWRREALVAITIPYQRFPDL